MKILILGHGQHGKDTVAQLLVEMYGFSFKSSSEEVFKRAVWPELWTQYLDRGDDVGPDNFTHPRIQRAIEECYADRRNRRELWRKLIREYNTPDAARLAKEIIANVDIYVGMRDADEFAECRRLRLFDVIIWVTRPGHPIEESMHIEYEYHTMAPVINIDMEDVERRNNLLRGQLRKIFGLPPGMYRIA